MSVDLTDPKKLNAELQAAMVNLSDYHQEMAKQRNYYMTSAFYQRKSGDTPLHQELSANLLRVFADKNIHYISDFPIIKVPTMGADEYARTAASMREKILYSVHRSSNTPVLQTKWAYDSTIFSMAIAESGFDLKKRCAFVKRYDPRYCFWQLSNDNDKRVLAFWAVFPITDSECIERYGFKPTGGIVSSAVVGDPYLSAIDGQNWHTMAIRWDENTRVAWVGDRIIEEPHNHQMGEIPVDICMPFDDYNTNNQGSFYLDPMLPLQAELNHTLKQRANIVQRMANPLVWGRGIISKQFDGIKDNLSKGGGGFVGLKQQGELGLLQVQETALLDKHIEQLQADMMRLSNFSAASFGESVGANTSGDALGMYFTPTEKFVAKQQIHWTAFHQSINAKILKFTEKFGVAGEKFQISGYAPAPTVIGITSGEDMPTTKGYAAGGFQESFDPREIIAGNYINIVTWPSVTPKNQVAEDTFWLNAMTQGQISKTTGYEKLGFDSPQDELDLLTQEQSNPTLNPDGTQKILQSAAQYAQATNPQQPTGALAGQLPAATPSPVVAPNG
jgi:hypothetical protein